MPKNQKKAGPVIRSGLLSIKPYQPGRALSEVKRELGIQRLAKLASNENPLGPSPKAKRAVVKAAAQVHRYPEGNAYALRLALSKRWAIRPDQFVFGNGSNEILILAAQAYSGPGKKIVYSERSFVVYEQAAIQAGAKVEAVASPNFEHDLDALVKASTHAALVYICNPNNPTGSWHPAKKIEKALSQIPRRCLIVLDEAYAEYCGQSFLQDKRWLAKFPNLLICRTFSKVYGLAGLRIGYGIAQPEIIQGLERCRQPFNTNSPAQAAALAALGDQVFVKKSLALNARGMKKITAAFKRGGIWYKESKTNFVFFKEPDGALWNEWFLSQGLILRPMGPGYLRVSIGTDKETDRFLKAFKKAMERLK